MAYSDLTLKNATQVAYQDYDTEIKELIDAGKTPPFTIGELCKQKGVSIAEEYPHLNGQDISNWKIIDRYNTNETTGFYGCVIETNNGEAIVAFRGSEGMLNLSNYKNDWVESDFKLLNSTLTTQQGEAYEFMKRISKSDYIKNYDSLALTGHSLGGNLAMHSMVVSALPEVNLQGKIKTCVNFDGPGFSDEYVKEHMPEIKQVTDKITHYKWSPVGSMLPPLPGVEPIPLKVEWKLSITYYLIGRHATESLVFDGENAVRGEETVLDKVVEKFTAFVDDLPAPVGDTAVTVLSTLLYGGIWMYNQVVQDEELTDFGKGLVAAAIVYVVTHAHLIVPAAVTIICTLVVVSLTIFAVELIYDVVEFIVENVKKVVLEVCDWIKEKAEEFKERIDEALDKLKNWINNNFNPGYKYATNNPVIRVDTGKLRNYATMLRNIQKRVLSIDRRMDRLYGQVKLSDLKDLIKADLLTSYSIRITSAAYYLEQTASDFEKVEKELCAKL